MYHKNVLSEGRAPFALQVTVGMMTSAASLGWLSVLGTADDELKYQ